MIFYIEQKYTIEFYKVLIQNIIKAVRLSRLSIASDDFFSGKFQCLMLQTQWFLCLLIQIGSKYKETLRTVPNQLMYVYVSFFSKMLIEYVQVFFIEKIVSERQYILLASIKFIWFIVFVLLKRMSAGDNTKELMIGGTTCQTFFFKYKQQDRTMQPS